MANKGSFKKGDKRAGRPKGTPNKVTGDLKEAILRAFDEVGGEKYLVKIAKEEPKTFCALLGRVLPMQVTGKDGGDLTVKIVRYGKA